MPDAAALRVVDDENDFYGRRYYGELLTDVYQYPSLEDRARADLLERCMFWLDALLRIKLPPARVLELGCAHGGFVAMMRWAGFVSRPATPRPRPHGPGFHRTAIHVRRIGMTVN